jgi:uncharacterized protein (DUF4415 family)
LKLSASSRRARQRGANGATSKKAPKLNAKLRKELNALERLRDDEIDTSDIPEQATEGKQLVGLFYRPVKKSVTIRLDADMLDWFKSKGRGYQTTINWILRRHFAEARK